MGIKLPPVEKIKRPSVCAEYVISSPMYLHGADPAQVVDRISPQSVKGALRFWWRAVHWGDFLQMAQGDRVEALRRLAEEDARLWGAADESIGQGRALLQIRQSNEKLTSDNIPSPGYLRGLGLKSIKAIVPGQHFSLKVLLKSSGAQLEQDRAQVRRALQAFGVFGGLGSRARHGLGSVQLLALEDVRFDSWAQHEKAIRELLRHGQVVETRSPYTALSARTRCYIVREHNWADVLNVVSNSLMEYRHTRFAEDAQAILAVANGGSPPSDHPKRAIFGLPHNYYFPDLNVSANVDGWHETTREVLRRASPLFIHVNGFDNEAVGVLTLFEADFLPLSRDGVAHLQIKSNRNIKKVTFSPDWRVIGDFLMHELPDAQRIKP